MAYLGGMGKFFGVFLFLINGKLRFNVSTLWVFFVNMNLNCSYQKHFSAQNAPNTVWRRLGSVRTRWGACSAPQASCWIKGSLYFLEEGVWEESGRRRWKGGEGRDPREEGKRTSRKPLILWMLDTPLHADKRKWVPERLYRPDVVMQTFAARQKC